MDNYINPFAWQELVRNKTWYGECWMPYGRDRWQAGKQEVKKPFLTAKDIIFLREMKIGL